MGAGGGTDVLNGLGFGKLLCQAIARQVQRSQISSECRQVNQKATRASSKFGIEEKSLGQQGAFQTALISLAPKRLLDGRGCLALALEIRERCFAYRRCEIKP
jgi:hypothetical protein